MSQHLSHTPASKKLALTSALVLACVLLMALAPGAFAEGVPTGEGGIVPTRNYSGAEVESASVNPAAAAGLADTQATAASVILVDNLQPSYTTPGGGGVFAAYIGPLAYGYVSPGTTAVYDGREAGIIKAGLAVDPTSGHYEDEGLFAVIPNVTIGVLAAGTLTYDVQNQAGVNPVWMTIEIDTGTVGDRSDNTTYQHVPTSNPAGWHTVDAAAGQWQKWNNNAGDVTGNPLMSLSDVASAHAGLNVVRAYLRLGMGDSYNNGGTGTIAWVDKATIGGMTYDFVLPTYWYVAKTGSDSNEGTLASPFLTIQKAVDSAGPGDTVHVMSEGGAYPGGYTISTNGLTINLNGSTIGHGSPAFTITGDDVTIQGPGVIDGNGSADPGILVLAGADNFTLRDIEVRKWNDGVRLTGDVVSLKIAGNWFHDNTDDGLSLESGVLVGGVINIEGNLFKNDGGNGIDNNGDTLSLKAQYNSWGDRLGPAGPQGDGVSGSVDASNFTFVEPFMDMVPDTLAATRNVLQSQSFDVKLNVEAAKLYGLTFKLTYDPAYLTLNSTTFAYPWEDRCAALSAAPGVIDYRCQLLQPDPQQDVLAGTVATFNFTALPGSGNGPWTTYLDISHLAADTGGAGVGGAKIFVNNAGYGAPSVPGRDITDGNDGQVNITGIAQYTGFVDLQGRTNETGAAVQVYNQATKTGAVQYAGAVSTAGGSYTTSYIPPNLLAVASTYWLVIDRPLFLPTTKIAASSFVNSKVLSTRPTTTLSTVILLGGDATDDNLVDVLDAGCIGGDYAQSPATCGGSGSSDVNDDGVVDILDLSLMGGNYNKDFTPWTP